MDIASLAAAFRESKALTFVADVEGAEKTLTLKRSKGCWERLAKLAVSVGADSVECRDALGGVVAVVQVREREAASPSSSAGKPLAHRSEMGELFALVMESADRQVARYSSSVEAVLAAQTRALEAVTRRMEALDERVQASLAQREESLRGDTLALSAMAESLQAERAAVDQVITEAESSRQEEETESARMVGKLLEPVAASIAAKIVGGT